jgi:hypothetical protein
MLNPCKTIEGYLCSSNCLPDPELRICQHYQFLAAWKRKPEAEKLTHFKGIAENPPLSDDAVALARVVACPYRGSELPVSAYSASCCGGGPTRFECQLGKGSKPGQVTTRECLQCQSC